MNLSGPRGAITKYSLICSGLLGLLFIAGVVLEVWSMAVVAGVYLGAFGYLLAVGLRTGGSMTFKVSSKVESGMPVCQCLCCQIGVHVGASVVGGVGSRPDRLAELCLSVH